VMCMSDSTDVLDNLVVEFNQRIRERQRKLKKRQPIKVMRCRSYDAFCQVCGRKIPKGEWCVYLGTVYLFRDSGSIRIHFRCIDKLIEILKQLKEEWHDKICVDML